MSTRVYRYGALPPHEGAAEIAALLRTAHLYQRGRYDLAVSARDSKAIVKLLNDTWFGMPESSSVREEPGFFALCDLCEGVDDEDEEDDDDHGVLSF